MSKKKELAKNTLIILAGKVCTQFVSFFLLPLYTAVLVSEDFGLVDLVTTYVGLLVPIITLQLESALFRYLVDVRDNEIEKKSIISNVFIGVLIQLMIFLILYISILLFIDIKYEYYICAMIIATIFSNVLLQISRGLGDNIGYSIGSVIAGTLTIILNLMLLLVFKLGPSGMFISTIFSNMICGIFIFARLKLNKYIDLKYLNREAITRLLRYSIPLIPNGVIWWIINVSDRTIVSIFLGSSANGIYAIANKFSGIFISVYNIFNISWTESASLHINSEDRDEFFSTTISGMFKLFGAICLSIIVGIPFVFPVIINSQYSLAYNYIPILMVATLLNVFVGLVSAIYVAKKLTKEIAKTSFLSGVINIIGNLIMIRYIGIYGAAISTLLSFFIMAIYRYIDVQKYVKIKLDKLMIAHMTLVFTVSIYLYYKNNTILNVLNLIIMLIYTYYYNKEIIINTLKTVRNKVNIKVFN